MSLAGMKVTVMDGAAELAGIPPDAPSLRSPKPRRAAASFAPWLPPTLSRKSRYSASKPEPVGSGWMGGPRTPGMARVESASTQSRRYEDHVAVGEPLGQSGRAVEDRLGSRHEGQDPLAGFAAGPRRFLGIRARAGRGERGAGASSVRRLQGVESGDRRTPEAERVLRRMPRDVVSFCGAIAADAGQSTLRLPSVVSQLSVVSSATVAGNTPLPEDV